MWLEIDGIQFNTDALKGITEEEFKALYKGKLRDVDKAWKVIRAKIPKSPTAKKRKRGRK